MEFKVGQKVCRKNHWGRFELSAKDSIGIVIGFIESSNKYIVDFGHADSASKLDASDLKDEASLSDLEDNYKKMCIQIKDKMVNAATLIGEANKIARDAKCNLSEMYEEIQPLLNSLGSVGWNTSSFGC